MDLNKKEDEVWNMVAVDGDMETQLQWIRTNVVLGQSKVQIRWSIPIKTLPGTYRIRHVGKYKVYFNRYIDISMCYTQIVIFYYRRILNLFYLWKYFSIGC